MRRDYGPTRPTPYYESAYDIAVRNGFRGTEKEWLASLRGTPGPAYGNVVSVSGYGAAGDGVRDDSDSIQAALDGAGRNGTVLLDADKTYLVTKTLTLRDGQTFDGNGGTILWKGEPTYDEDGKIKSAPHIMEATGSVEDEIAILEPPLCVGNVSSGSYGAGNKAGFTYIKVGQDPGWETGDRIVIQAARCAMQEDSGEYWTGTATGSTAQTYWAEVLVVNDVEQTGTAEWTVRCIGTLTYPYYLPDREPGVDIAVKLTEVCVENSSGGLTAVGEYAFTQVLASASGVKFPDDHTMVLPSDCGLYANAPLEISGLSTYKKNNGGPYGIVSVSDDGKTITFPNKTFEATGDEGDTGTASLAISPWLSREHSTVRKVNFLAGVTVKDLTVLAQGKAHSGDTAGSSASDWTGIAYANTIWLSLCEGAVIDNVHLSLTDMGRGFAMTNCWKSEYRNSSYEADYRIYAVTETHTYTNAFTFASTWSCAAINCKTVRAGQSFDTSYAGTLRCPALYTVVRDCTVTESMDSAATNHSGGWGEVFEGCRFINCARPLAIRAPMTMVKNCTFAGHGGNFIPDPSGTVATVADLPSRSAMTGVYFPDRQTMTLPSAGWFKAGERIYISGLSTYKESNGGPYTILSVNAAGTVLTFAENTFKVSGSVEDTGSARFVIAGEGYYVEATQKRYAWLGTAWVPNQQYRYGNDSFHVQFAEPTCRGCVVEGCSFFGGKAINVSPYLSRYFNFKAYGTSGNYYTMSSYVAPGADSRKKGGYVVPTNSKEHPYPPSRRSLGIVVQGNVFSGCSSALWVTKTDKWNKNTAETAITDYGKADCGVSFLDNVVVDCGRNFYPVYLEAMSNGTTLEGNRFIRCVAEDPTYYGGDGKSTTAGSLIYIGPDSVRVTIRSNRVEESGGGFAYLYNKAAAVSDGMGTNGNPQMTATGNMLDNRVGDISMAIAATSDDVETEYAQVGKSAADRFIESVDAAAEGDATASGFHYDFPGKQIDVVTGGVARVSVTGSAFYSPFKALTPQCLLRSWCYIKPPAEATKAKWRIAVYDQYVSEDAYRRISACWDNKRDEAGNEVTFSDTVVLRDVTTVVDPETGDIVTTWQDTEYPAPINELSYLTFTGANAQYIGQTAREGCTYAVDAATGVVTVDVPAGKAPIPTPPYDHTSCYAFTVVPDGFNPEPNARFYVFCEVKQNTTGTGIRVNTQSDDNYPSYFDADMRTAYRGPIDQETPGIGDISAWTVKYITTGEQLTLGTSSRHWKNTYTDKLTVGATELTEAQLIALKALL